MVAAWLEAKLGHSNGRSTGVGFAIDIEILASEPKDVAALTSLNAKAATFATPRARWLVDKNSTCGTLRDYDFKGLADATDYLVAME